MLTTIVAAYLFAYAFIVILQGDLKLKKILCKHHTQRIKPFDCLSCLSMWAAIVLLLLPQYVSDYAFVAFGAAWLGNKFN